MTAPKPPPQEMWAIADAEGTIFSAHSALLSAAFAHSRVRDSDRPLKIVRVRVEVIDD